MVAGLLQSPAPPGASREGPFALTGASQDTVLPRSRDGPLKAETTR